MNGNVEISIKSYSLKTSQYTHDTQLQVQILTLVRNMLSVISVIEVSGVLPLTMSRHVVTVIRVEYENDQEFIESL